MTLFDPAPCTAIAGPPPLSPEAKRTKTRRTLLASGVHPATRVPLLNDDWNYHCGDCAHPYHHQPGNNRFHKCGLVAHTNGPGTDIRISWPACQHLRIPPRPSTRPLDMETTL